MVDGPPLISFVVMPLITHHSLLALVVFATWANVARASGWNDYDLSIDPDFKIVRCNSLEVCLAHSDGMLVYVPSNYQQTGPIDGYHVTPTHVFLRTLGRLPRNSFEGDTYELVDSTRQFFFVFDKAAGSLAGPYAQEEFQADPAARLCGEIKWTPPINPNVLRPLLGGAMILAVLAVILGVPILLAIGVTAWIACLVRSHWRSKAHRA